MHRKWGPLVASALHTLKLLQELVLELPQLSGHDGSTTQLQHAGVPQAMAAQQCPALRSLCLLAAGADRRTIAQQLPAAMQRQTLLRRLHIAGIACKRGADATRMLPTGAASVCTLIFMHWLPRLSALTHLAVNAWDATMHDTNGLSNAVASMPALLSLEHRYFTLMVPDASNARTRLQCSLPELHTRRLSRALT